MFLTTKLSFKHIASHSCQKCIGRVLLRQHEQSNFLRFFTNISGEERCFQKHRRNNRDTNRDKTLLSLESNKRDVFGNLKVPLEKNKYKKVKSESKKETIRKITMIKRKSKSDGANKFGTLSDKDVWISPLEEDTEPGSSSTLEFPEYRKYRTPEAYLRQMKLLVKEKKLKEALDLFPDMKKNNVFPAHFNYTYMIGACGRVGYTDMAFQLLRQLTDRGYRPSAATLTGVFNSCAESPFPERALKSAKQLKEKALQNNWLLTQPTYHAMIKSFGKCGDIEGAFQVVDEMIESGTRVNSETYSFLLMSCITDKEAGFTHAIEVWRKMMAKKIPPSAFTFNLLLRAVRDCGVGPEEISSLLLQHWSSYKKRPYGLNKEQKSITEQILKLQSAEIKLLASKDTVEWEGENSALNKDVCEKKIEDTELLIAEDCEPKVLPKVIPNILSQRPVDGAVFSDLLNIQTSSDRLALVGNAEGFLALMKAFNVNPNIKTFTMLLESLEAFTEEEEKLISLLDQYEVVPDVDFFNLVIKRRHLRYDHTAAKNVLVHIKNYNLSPDVVTFGVLALGCQNSKHGFALLSDMKRLNYHPNVEIMGALIHHACFGFDFKYLESLLKIMRNLEVDPNEKVIKKIEETLNNARTNILHKERDGIWEKQIPFDDFLSSFRNFKEFYSKWLEDMNLDLDDHPWAQYQTDIIYRENANRNV